MSDVERWKDLLEASHDDEVRSDKRQVQLSYVEFGFIICK